MQGQVIRAKIRYVEWVLFGTMMGLSFYEYTMLDIAPARN